MGGSYVLLAEFAWENCSPLLLVGREVWCGNFQPFVEMQLGKHQNPGNPGTSCICNTKLPQNSMVMLQKFKKKLEFVVSSVHGSQRCWKLKQCYLERINMLEAVACVGCTAFEEAPIPCNYKCPHAIAFKIFALGIL